MKVAQHSLELFVAPEENVRDAVRSWLADKGFRLQSRPDDPHIRATTGSSIGVSDRQTPRTMEVLVNSVGDVTGVSVFHHTTRVLFIVGAMFSDILRAEANSLVNYLRRQYVTER